MADFQMSEAGETSDVQFNERKQMSLIKTFGWISFGIAVLYLLGGIVNMLSKPMMDTFSQMSMQLNVDGKEEVIAIQNEMVQKLFNIKFYLSTYSVIVASIIIIGSIGFVTFKGWGRKLYIAGCVLAILANIGTVYESFYAAELMDEFLNQIANSAGDKEHLTTANFTGVSSIMTTITVIFAIIPIAYLIINIFIANSKKTKALMV